MTDEKYDRPEHINDLVVVLCGASSGFGRGVAFRLAEQGARVVIAARRKNMLDDMAAEIETEGGKALAVEADVSNADDVKAISQAALDNFGRIDVWINNVGIGALGLFWDIPIEDQARVIDVNLKGLMYGAHAAVTQFRKQGYGTLINTGSIDSEVPLAYQTTYAATKAGVLSLSRSLNAELGLVDEYKHIKVATIMPWAVDTPWWLHAANYTGHQPRMAAMDDPDFVVDAIIKACTDPQEEMPVGIKAHASDKSHHLFPDLTEKMSAELADREVNKAGHLRPTTGSIYQPSPDTGRMNGGIRERMKQEDKKA